MRMSRYVPPELDWGEDCHRIPQSKYVISDDQQQMYCDHVIRLENLTNEFNALMQAYNLSHRMADQAKNVKKLDCQISLSEEVKMWLYRSYRMDFDLFGYSLDGDG